MNASVDTAQTRQPDHRPLHLAYLDGLRALAALFVVWFHSFCQSGVSAANTPRAALTFFHLFAQGHLGVDVFIVLSGFCLALPVIRGDGRLKGGVITFFKKRARRILPPYYAALCLSILLIVLAIGRKTGSEWDITLPVDTKSVFAHLLMYQDVFHDTSSKINYAMWSISVEWRIYFAFPLILALRRWWGSAWTAFAALIVSYTALYIGATYLNSTFNFSSHGLTPWYLALFSIGVLVADIAYGKDYKNVMLLRNSALIQSALFLLTVVVAVVARPNVWHGKNIPDPLIDLTVGVWTAAALLTAANPQVKWLNKILSWKPFVAIGTFSYSIYLIHAPLIQVLWQYVLDSQQRHPFHMFLGLFFIGTPLIVAISYLFFLAFERPFLNKAKQEKHAGAGQQAPAAIAEPILN